MSITFAYPADIDEQKRLSNILALMQRMPMGEALLDHITDARGHDSIQKLTICFNPNMGDIHGMYQRKDDHGAVSLSTHLSDEALAGVLLHELRHAQQPMSFYNREYNEMTTLALTQMRIKEGDAFAHHFCALLDSPDDEVARQGLALIAKPLQADVRDLLAIQADNWVNATTPEEKRAVMREVFWVMQATRFDKYDSDTIDKIAEYQKGEIRRPIGENAFQRTLNMVIDTSLLPGLLADGRESNYLGENFTQIAMKLVKTSDEARVRHDKFSVIDHDATLPYSKPDGNDSLKFGR